MKRWISMILFAALLLSGCVSAQRDTLPQLGSAPTVEDIFTIPLTTLPSVTNAPGVTQPNQTTQPTKPNSGSLGGMGFGIDSDDMLIDAYGSYYLYEGDEMCLPFSIEATGQTAVNCVEYGVGILLFLDGQPQPYRAGKDGELAYFHIFYPDFDLNKVDEIFPQKVIYDLYFTPVVGEAGDTVEFYAATISTPNWQRGDPQMGFKYTSGSMAIGTRLLMEATPPATAKPEVTERIHTLDITQVDASYFEIGSWSDRELIEKYDYEFYVNGQTASVTRTTAIYGISADEEVELRFEVWGTPSVDYGLMFYVDNQPISSEQTIHFDMENGKKTVITVTMDLIDFDGECVVYAALIPRNGRTTEILTFAFIDMVTTYYLRDDQKTNDSY